MSDSADYFLEISSRILNEGASTNEIDEDKLELASTLVRLLEADQRFEIPFATNKVMFAKLLDLGFKALKLIPESGHQVQTVLGNISSNPQFSDLVNVSKDDEIFKVLTSCIDSDDKTQVAIGCTVLGNLITDSDKVDNLVKEKPDIIVKIMTAYSKMTSPFELQSTHLIKNMSLVDTYKRQLLQNHAIDIVEKMTEISLFAEIRLLGVQIARNLLTNTKIDGRLVDILASRFKKEDDETVKLYILQAFSASTETLVGQNELESPLWTPIVDTLVKGTSYIISSEDIASCATVLLKLTKAIGLLSMENMTRKYLLTDHTGPILTIILNQSNQVKKQICSPTDVLFGVINNLGFIGAKVKDHYDHALLEAATIAIKSCSTV